MADFGVADCFGNSGTGPANTFVTSAPPEPPLTSTIQPAPSALAHYPSLPVSPHPGSWTWTPHRPIPYLSTPIMRLLGTAPPLMDTYCLPTISPVILHPTFSTPLLVETIYRYPPPQPTTAITAEGHRKSFYPRQLTLMVSVLDY